MDKIFCFMLLLFPPSQSHYSSILATSTIARVMYSSILQQHSNTSPKLLYSFLLAHSMEGGPRTFPSCINKWQWKHPHEKKAKEKKKRHLAHEKQLYEARIRSQIGAKLTGKPDPGFSSNSDHPTHNPMFPQDHVKAL